MTDRKFTEIDIKNNTALYEINLREAAQRMVDASRVEARGFASATAGAARSHDTATAAFRALLANTPPSAVAAAFLELHDLRSDLARARAEAEAEAYRWQPIATAPKDGTHILACESRSTFGYKDGAPLPPKQTVVHWWANPGEEGFYTSINEMEPQHPFDASHWKPLDAPLVSHLTSLGKP